MSKGFSSLILCKWDREFWNTWIVPDHLRTHLLFEIFIYYLWPGLPVWSGSEFGSATSFLWVHGHPHPLFPVNWGDNITALCGCWRIQWYNACAWMLMSSFFLVLLITMTIYLYLWKPFWAVHLVPTFLKGRSCLFSLYPLITLNFIPEPRERGKQRR